VIRTLLTFTFLVAGIFCSANAQDVSYRSQIRPLWEEKCGACHGADAPYYGDFKEAKDDFIAQDLGPRMDTYADLIYFIGWPDSGAVMRRLDDGKNHADGKPGDMYEYLGESEQERQKNLQLFKAWIGNWNLKRWNTRGDVPGVTKEELDALKLKY
jgi:hypothetical protein